MPNSYSQDLRDRVIDAVLIGGMSRRAAAIRFGVSESSAIKWVQRFERLGDRKIAGTGGHRRSEIKPHQTWIFQLIDAHKDITLEALAKLMAVEFCVRVDTGRLSRFFKKEGYSFKKKRFTQ